MDTTNTEAEKDRVIAQHSRYFYRRHMDARVLRRTLAKEDRVRRVAERAERMAMDALIGIIETVDKTSGSKTNE